MKNLKEVLELHRKWLNSEKEGIRANLSNADLSNTDLSNTDLRCANLTNANLSYADLSKSNLINADLSGANLNEAKLNEAKLSGANLSKSNLINADLSYADLKGVNLSNADLSHADLSHADLSNADLKGVNLSNANLNYANLNSIKYNYLSVGLNLVCPEEGSYIGYKKARTKNREEVIIKLLITEDALRSSATTRKCRCSKAKVLTITSLDEIKTFNEAYSNWDKTFIYRVGEVVEVNDFDTNRWNECSTGIHHFITRKEAAKY